MNKPQAVAWLAITIGVLTAAFGAIVLGLATTTVGVVGLYVEKVYRKG